MTIKDAIYALKYMKNESVNSFRTDALDMAIEALQKQKTGKWIYLGDGYKCPWSCSECDSCSTEKTDYCTDCGAKLEI